MSTFTFRKAARENVGLLIGFNGESGSGKTYSAMRMALGLAGGKPFAVIDTEAGRAKHYVGHKTDTGHVIEFDHGDLAAPFSPDRYVEAIEAADKAGYPVIVVDSASHEWAGDGGVLDMQEAELDRMAGDDWGKRERVKMAAWIKPKMAHKRMVQRLLQVRAHLILCFRTEPKVDMVKNATTGKLEIVPKKSITGLDGWIPVCEKNLPYELTMSFLMHADRPGIPRPIKLQEQHRPMIPLDKPITEEAGRLLAEWAAGGSVRSERASAPAASAGETATGVRGVLLRELEGAADKGTMRLQEAWSSLTRAQRQMIGEAGLRTLQARAAKAAA